MFKQLKKTWMYSIQRNLFLLFHKSNLIICNCYIYLFLAETLMMFRETLGICGSQLKTRRHETLIFLNKEFNSSPSTHLYRWPEVYKLPLKVNKFWLSFFFHFRFIIWKLESLQCRESAEENVAVIELYFQN